VVHQHNNEKLAGSTIADKIRQVYKLYARLKQDTGRRDHWIKQLIKAQSIDQQVTKKSLWKKIRTTEKVQNNARMIKAALAGTTSRRGLNHVIGPTPSDPTQRTESKTKTELETLCLAEARRRFMQAANTPFLQAPLLQIFTEANLVTKAFNQVLAGTFVCPDVVDELMKRLLWALR